MDRRNVAARAAHWSAEHRKTAIFGWLAFVFVAVMLGNSVGQNQIHGADQFSGEAGRAEHALEDAGLRPNNEAVLIQSPKLTGTVTSAAIVMVAVFLVFGTLSFLDFKEMGIGLAAVVLVDATVVRGVLLPASMKVLGEWNWYLPRWLEWLPHGQEPDSRGAGTGELRLSA
jgi:uncharacterized membrane protein YdfJ with MMPL/SSD domain